MTSYCHFQEQTGEPEGLSNVWVQLKDINEQWQFWKCEFDGTWKSLLTFNNGLVQGVNVERSNHPLSRWKVNIYLWFSFLCLLIFEMVLCICCFMNGYLFLNYTEICKLWFVTFNGYIVICRNNKMFWGETCGLSISKIWYFESTVTVYTTNRSEVWNKDGKLEVVVTSESRFQCHSISWSVERTIKDNLVLVLSLREKCERLIH